MIEFASESGGSNESSSSKREKDSGRRHRDMMNAGWRVICVDRAHLRLPETFIRHLVSELRRCGVRTRQPFGGLWRPVTEDILGQMQP